MIKQQMGIYEKKKKKQPKTVSCKCWRFDSIIIRDNFSAMLSSSLASLLKIGVLIFHLSLSALIFFGGCFGVCVVLFCFDLKTEERKTPVVKRR